MTPARRGLFQLASALHMTVQQIEKNMTVGELVEWIEFFNSDKKSDEVDLASATPQQLGALFRG
jgi:hypothetical protein